ncbi:MAG: hypothetical protein NBV68_06480 [Erythrobacter sp.]|uniref:hypothetical protein n=1 Tax=Erythrobacter sp. TaxID=1042 RepID=UPI0025CC7922|nr:hypothetical protein [Erythrobacter sp.]MCL9999009.1 hypothetical protein [Erythrobacter sp.]
MPCALRPDAQLRLAVAGPKWFGVKPVAAAAVVRQDATIAASDLMREAEFAAAEKDVSAQATGNDIANEVAKDPAELLADPGLTEAVDPAVTIERAGDPLRDAVTLPGPDRTLDVDAMPGATSVKDTATGAGGPV